MPRTHTVMTQRRQRALEEGLEFAPNSYEDPLFRFRVTAVPTQEGARIRKEADEFRKFVKARGWRPWTLKEANYPHLGVRAIVVKSYSRSRGHDYFHGYEFVTIDFIKQTDEYVHCVIHDEKGPRIKRFRPSFHAVWVPKNIYSE